jgi:hypothetical protein
MFFILLRSWLVESLRKWFKTVIPGNGVLGNYLLPEPAAASSQIEPESRANQK